jgi:cytochrome c peroxidase
LQGLKTFFTQPSGSSESHAGNCVACHTPPNFSDFKFHNNGASQVEYDAVFGQGAFFALSIPDLATRNAHFGQYLPPSADHPEASSRFRSPVSAANPGYTDLGVWNIVGNPDIPAPQEALDQILCPQFNLNDSNCANETLLPLTIAYFKTPPVRDLGQSNPYLHNGSMNTIADVINFYLTTSALARAGTLRAGSPEMSDVEIDQTDVAPIAAFLRALNEDYD